jgi:excisionase family DNA binding protein
MQTRTPRAEPPPPISVSVQQAAAMIGLSRSKLYEYIAAGQLKSRAAGRRRVILVDDLRRFVAELPERAD